ncbi:IS4 family transposase, partial [Arcobacter sp. F2176]|uniref:IS4 family transposase n=1 Tax=Arcobacter sp. F2176 TaxID=2044511 RepID=UPI00100A794A
MNKEDFTRNRKLPFSKVLLTVVRKSVKSIQNVLNETQKYLSTLLDEDLETISKSAYSQARDKLNYTAFEELANDASDMMYRDYDYKTYKGYRLLAIDGSMVTLPNNDDIKQEFCTTNVVNQYEDKSKTIVQARVSVLYDVLNNITLDSIITNSKIGEITIAKDNHFKKLNKNDLVIMDRGYPSYELFTTIITQYKADFLIRMKKSCYKDIQFLFDKNSELKDTIITLKPTTKKLTNEIIEQNLPLEVKVRFVQVILEDGEVEVLATSVLDNEVLETKDFKELYFKRWKIETFYEIIKNRLSLENFTGLSALAIKQDFYATIFISNLETIVVQSSSEELTNKTNTKFKQKINKSVSFNTIKNYCFELFYSNKDIEVIFDEMSKLFLTSTVQIRPNRKFKRPSPLEGKNTKGIKSANFSKRKKKSVF